MKVRILHKATGELYVYWPLVNKFTVLTVEECKDSYSCYDQCL